MVWTWREDEELAELMQDFAHFEPAIERIYRTETQLDQMQQRIEKLEERKESDGSN
jgi:phage shock protein A